MLLVLVLVLAFGRVAQFSQPTIKRRQQERVVALHGEVAAHERMQPDHVVVEYGRSSACHAPTATNTNGCRSSVGTSLCGLGDDTEGVAWRVDAVVFLGEVIVPAGVEIAVADQGA